MGIYVHTAREIAHVRCTYTGAVPGVGCTQGVCVRTATSMYVAGGIAMTHGYVCTPCQSSLPMRAMNAAGGKDGYTRARAAHATCTCQHTTSMDLNGDSSERNEEHGWVYRDARQTMAARR